MWQQLELVSELEFDLRDIVDWGKTQLISSYQSNNSGAVDVKIDGSAIVEKPSYIVSFTKAISRKIRALIRSRKFICPKLAPYLYAYPTRPCVKYCCHIWFV